MTPDIDELKSRISLTDLMQGSGIPLRQVGKNLMARCPFHPDKEASLSVNSEAQLWNCFGCQAGGDALSFVQKLGNLSFSEAVERLRELAEPGQVRPQAGNGKSTLPAEVDPTELFERVANLYHENLASHPRAQDYLASRGFSDFSVLRTFKVGFCCGSRLAQLAAEGGQTRQALKAVGLLNERSREVLSGCVVVPLRDREGYVRGFSGRRIALDDKNPHRLLAGPRRGLFYPEAARGTSQVLLVEGVLDALACYQAGFPHTLALGGARGLTEELQELLLAEDVKEVLLALDPDPAGDQGSIDVAQCLSRKGLRCRRVRLPDDLDPATYFLTQKGAAEVFGELLVQASIIGEAPPAESTLTAKDDEITLVTADLKYRARVAGKSNGKLRIQLRLEKDGKTLRDVLDVQSFKSRRVFANRAADRFGVLTDEVENHLEALADKIEMASELGEQEPSQLKIEMTPEQREKALAFLRRPDLLNQVLKDIEVLGYVGEEEAKLLVYLIATSRKLDRPLAGIVGSGSGAGKSFLTEMAEKLCPPEDVVLYSRLSAQALGYMAENALKHKLLVLEERAGGEAADYQIRTLQSKKRLTQAVVIKDPSTGQMRTRHFEVEGPIAYLETTTCLQLNPENTSRCFEIPLDESPIQTRRIHQRQREGRLLKSVTRNARVDAISTLHHNAQRLLEPVKVVIPYAEHLTFPDQVLRTRRDNERFLGLIEVVAFLHQFQRQRRSALSDDSDGIPVAYIEATIDDYRVAYRLANKVLVVSLDELSRWARELLTWLAERDDGSEPWTRRQLREQLRWPDRRLRESLQELADMEHLDALRGTQGQAYLYRLSSGNAAYIGGLNLLPPDELEARYSSGET